MDETHDEGKKLKEKIRDIFSPVNQTILIDALETQVIAKIDDYFAKKLFFDTTVLDFLIAKYEHEQEGWKEGTVWFANPEFPHKFKKLLKALRYVREDVSGYQEMEKAVNKMVPAKKILTMPKQKPFTDDPPVFCPNCGSLDINDSTTGDLECASCGHCFREKEIEKNEKR